jgi:hypothetical protein
MARVLELVGIWSVSLPLVSVALRDFTSEQRRSAAWRHAVLAEYDQRLCGALSAARANLTSAALLVPDGRAAEVASALAASLESHYGRPQADEACTAPAHSLLRGHAMALHRETHHGQPNDWPNWVARVRW